MKIHSINARMPFYDGIEEVSSENDGKVRRFRMQHLLFTVQLHSWEVEKWDKRDPDDQEEAIRKALPKKVRESLKKENHSHDSHRIAHIQSETAAILKSNELLRQKLNAKASAKAGENPQNQQPVGDPNVPDTQAPVNQPADSQTAPPDPDEQELSEIGKLKKELDDLNDEITAAEEAVKAAPKAEKNKFQCKLNALIQKKARLFEQIATAAIAAV